MTLDALAQSGFDIQTVNHARAVLSNDFPEPLQELCDVLIEFRIADVELIQGGGGEAESTQRLRRSLTERDWVKRRIVIKKIVDEQERSAISHEIDHVRATENGSVALEIEWNNKDPFFDRDLENFQRLHGEGVLSVGIIVTRGQSLQDNLVDIVAEWARVRGIETFDELARYGIHPTIRQEGLVRQRRTGDGFENDWARRFVQDKFGTATTHWAKLQQRIQRGVGNPCPLLLIGIPADVILRTNPDD